MAHLHRSGGADEGVPPTNKSMLVVAGVLLAIPVVALLWVSTYNQESPTLAGFPFFFWYQFLWVFLCAGCTYAAHRLVLAARKPDAGTTGNPPVADDESLSRPDDGAGR